MGERGNEWSYDRFCLPLLLTTIRAGGFLPIAPGAARRAGGRIDSVPPVLKTRRMA